MKTAAADHLPLRQSPAQTSRRRAMPAPSPTDMVQHLQGEVHRLRVQLQQQQSMIDELEALALVDPLTSLANRRAFENSLAVAWSDYQRYRRDGALLMIDLNKFKEINDQYGHQAGDQALRHIAELLKGHLRTSDLVARLGGDEFAIILHQINPDALESKLAELAVTIESSPFRFGQYEIDLSASIGACLFAGASSRNQLVAHADADMYRQKQRDE